MACLAHQTLVELVGDGLSERKRLEVEHHIDECPRCRKAVAELIASGSVPRVPASEELAPGGQLGTYALLSVVGAGAMGTVYAARDTTLERRVAIKLLHARHDDGQVRSRLLREAQAMARLSHPNVVSVHHAGVIDNRVYLVMELVEGTTLRAWSEQAHRTCQDIVQVFLQAGAGIAAAHETGIIHRDFKPENVLVGINQRICVTDFGLAAVVDPASQPFGHDDAPSGVRSEPTHPMTRTGAMVGTPAYMAPEQMTHQRVGPAADQFAFCVALYELLHGHRPFAGETIEELHAAIQADRVRLASNRAVPGWLSQILVRGLSASPDARFPSMNDLLAALRSGGRHRRRTIGIAAGVGFAAVCGVAIWVMSAQRDHAREASCHAVEDRFAAQFDDRRWQAIGTAFLATGVNHAVTSWDRTRGLLRPYADEWQRAHAAICASNDGSGDARSRRLECLADAEQQLTALTRLLEAADPTTVERATNAAAFLPNLSACTDARRAPARREPLGPTVRPGAARLRERIATAKMQLLLGQRAASAKAGTLMLEAHELGVRDLELEVQAFGKLARAQLDSAPSQVMGLSDRFDGRGYPELAMGWWRWLHGTPYSRHPLNPAAHASCGGGQTGAVWYLGGVWWGDQTTVPPPITRHCVVPANTALFFPITAASATTIPRDNCGDVTPAALAACATAYHDAHVIAELEIDGIPFAELEKFRVTNPPFPLRLTDDSWISHENPEARAGDYVGVADGLYVLLRPLPPGDHVVHFYTRGSDGFTLDIGYRITVERG